MNKTRQTDIKSHVKDIWWILLSNLTPELPPQSRKEHLLPFVNLYDRSLFLESLKKVLQSVIHLVCPQYLWYLLFLSHSSSFSSLYSCLSMPYHLPPLYATCFTSSFFSRFQLVILQPRGALTRNPSFPQH